MRIVQVANFVTPTSGGLRTALQHLATGYADSGHDVVQLVPGPAAGERGTTWGHQVVLRAPSVPGTGYRLLVDLEAVRRRLADLRPDVLEVHDRSTLRGLGRWARAFGIPSLVVSHERLDRLLEQWVPSLGVRQRFGTQQLVDRSNRSLALTFDSVVCTTAWAAQEFLHLQSPRPVLIPLGVDVDRFRYRLDNRDPGTAGCAPIRLIMASRLSREKRPELALATAAELVGRSVPVQLIVAGDGPRRHTLQRQARALPVRWLGFVADRDRLAGLMADADIALAPGPVETFGLAALEAMACGTPVVVNARSALPDVVGPHAGRAATGTGRAFADAVQDLLDVPEVGRRSAARARAATFRWEATVQAFLEVHDRALSGRIG